MVSNPNHPTENDVSSTHLPEQKGMMEFLAKKCRQAILPLALLTGGCATVQAPYGAENTKGDKVGELVPIYNNRPTGFEATKTKETPNGLVLDLGTPFKVGAGFIVQFRMVDTPMGEYPEAILAEKGVKASYDIVEQKTLMGLEGETRQRAEKLGNRLYVLREAKDALDEMLAFMKREKPTGYSKYDYGHFFEYLEGEIEKAEIGLNSLGISAMAKPTKAPETAKTAPEKSETGRNAEPWAGKTFSCYASDQKEASTVAAETFKAKFGKTKEEAGVELSIDFNEATGKATVTARRKGSSDIFTSERRGGGSGTAVTVDAFQRSKNEKIASVKTLERPESLAPVSHTPEIRKDTGNEEPALEFGTRAQNAELNKKILKLIIGSYERILKRNPTLKGKLIVRFVIQKNGSVGDIKFGKIKGGLENEDLEKAIREKIGNLKFKPQEDEQPIELPITLTPQN